MPKNTRRAAALTAVLAAALLMPVGAGVAVAQSSEQSSDTACEVTAGDLTWGVKESFRSYISGNIASGDWELSDGVTYETPEFSWPAADGSATDGPTDAGALDLDNLVGDVHFQGAVTFTGHDGKLNTTFSNPTLRFDGAEEVHLLFDVTGVSMEDALADNGAEPEVFEQVPLVKLDTAAVPFTVDGETLLGSDIPTTITLEGFEAFSMYEEGTEFDPISFTVTVDCTQPEPEPEVTPTEEATDETPVEVEEEQTTDAGGISPWLWVGIASVVVIGGGVIWAVRRSGGGSGGGAES